MTIQAGDITAELIRSKRKTISIEVRSTGIVVRAPRWASRSEIQRFLLRKESWIRKHQQIVASRQEQKELLPPFTEEELRELTEQAKRVIPAKVEYYAARIGVDYGRITIRHQKTRWGSCSGKGNLNFNCVLMLFPEEIIDNVVVHELCHRKYMDHSKRFYAEMEKAFPQYRECRRWLRENGSVQLSRLR
jgi:predicted metal-dependent hydrolase